MCGIAGLVGSGDGKLVRQMCDLIQHRGPDHHARFSDKDVVLGYRRLSIIDVKGGNQPLYNEDGSLAIVFNGEIYNYLQLKAILEKKGHKFKTNSDTETIVHGYEEYGPGIADKLRGMFAFAIWDSRKKQLFIARDKFGKKPLYYTSADGVFGFASEIKSLMLMPGFDKSLDYKALDSFLALRFIPAPRTIFKSVKKLPAAHCMIVKNGKIHLERYWAPDYSPQQHSEKYFASKLEKFLDGAVQARLMSEVPLGAYLSGGLDSSSVVALMARHSDQAVKTFSVGFGVEKYDELQYAKQIADEYSTDHHELIVTPKSIRHLPEIIWHLDEPMADPTAIPTYLLSKFAKKKVTVVLTGEGGDEVFGGYEQYKFMLLAYKYAKAFPRMLRRHVIAPAVRAMPKALLDQFFKYSSALGKKGLERFTHFISDLEKRERSYLDLVQIMDLKEREALYENKMKANDITKVAAPYFKRTFAENDLLSQMQLFDIATELPEDLLMKVDKMAMAASVEARAPLLDAEVAEFAFGIPSNLKMNGGNEKYIFRKAMSRILPQQTLKRKKMRFFVPLDYWFEGNLKRMAEKVLLESERKIFERGEIRKIISQYEGSRAYSARQLWNLMSFELWARVFLDRDGGKIPSLNELI